MCNINQLVNGYQFNPHEKNIADIRICITFIKDHYRLINTNSENFSTYPSGQGGILTFRTLIILCESKGFNLKSFEVIWDVHSLICDYRKDDGLFRIFRTGTSGWDEELEPSTINAPQTHAMLQTYPSTIKSHLGLDSRSSVSVAQQFSRTTAILESLDWFIPTSK